MRMLMVPNTTINKVCYYCGLDLIGDGDEIAVQCPNPKCNYNYEDNTNEYE